MAKEKKEKASQLPGEAELLKHLQPVSPQDEFSYCCTCCADCCNQAAGVDARRLLSAILFLKYINFDTDRPFMPQYRRNIRLLIHKLSDMA